MADVAARAVWQRRTAFAIAVGALGVLVVVPLLKLCQVVFDDRHTALARVLHAPGLSIALAHTCELALIVPAFSVPIGAAIALYLRRGDVPCRTVLRLAVLLPLVIPQFVLGYSWTQAYARAGFTDTVLGLRWSGLQGPIGVAVVMIVGAVPISFLLTTAGLATRAQPDLERAARVSGASTCDHASHDHTAVVAARARGCRSPQFCCCAGELCRATSSWHTRGIFHDHHPHLLRPITCQRPSVVRRCGDTRFGARRHRRSNPVTDRCGARPAVTQCSRQPKMAHHRRRARLSLRVAAPGVVLLGFLATAVGLPTAALVLASITRAIGVAPTPGNWTTDNFRTALDAPTITALVHSLELATAAACIVTLLGALLCALERRRAGRALGTAAILTFAVPGSTLAVGLLIAYGRRFDEGLALILLAYVAKFWAVGHRTLSAAVDRLPPAEVQAARSSGASPMTAVRTMWLPALAPALLAGWLIVFVTALHEVTMSSLLYGPGSQTLAVAVLNSQELGDVGSTAALSVVLTGLLLVGVLPAAVGVRLAASRRAPRRPAVVPSREAVGVY